MIERATTWADLPFVGIVLMVLCAAIICSYNMARNYHRELLRNFFRDKDRFAYADYSNSLLSSMLLIVCAAGCCCIRLLSGWFLHRKFYSLR